jgi:dihydroceramide fatty acyl 2-hydroxylase
MESHSIKRAELLRSSPPMFKSRWLDALSRVHPAVPVVVFGPVIVLTFVLGLERIGLGRALVAVVAGYVIWTLTEYWLHRLVFHFEPEAGIGARLHWIIHGVHHDHPNDPLRLVMPPSVSVPLATLFYLAFVALFGSGWGLAVFSGFIGGYLFYDMAHYYVHHHVPRSRVGRKLRELHMRHHFQDDTAGYGVSAPWWDRVFGTQLDPSRRG